MKTILITSPDTILSVDQTHFTLRSKGKKIGRIPPSLMGHVIVGAAVEVTRKALERLVDTGVGLTFLDNKGRNRSRLLPPWKNTPEVRLGQFRCHEDKAGRLEMSCKLVGHKIDAQIALLKRGQSNHREPAIAEAIATLKRARMRLPSAIDVAQVMGIEGWAAKSYWDAFGALIRVEWISWAGRNRRPPKDPANAALSYGYAILLNRVICLLEVAGLDPYIGYLHETSGRHPAFALDVMEPFRAALVDRTVLRLINLKQLRQEHFVQDPYNSSVMLDRAGRLLLLEALENEGRNGGETFFDGHIAIETAINQTVANLRAAAKNNQMETAQIHAPLGASSL